MQRAVFLMLVVFSLAGPQLTEAWGWRSIARYVPHHENPGNDVYFQIAITAASVLGKRSAADVDVNGDDVISHGEMARLIGERASHEQLEDLMDFADANGDGKVTRDEFTQMMA